MLAFESAVSLGVEHLETDVHVSADGVIHCIHDHTVDRTTEGSGPFSSLSSAEISGLDAGYRHRDGSAHRFRGKGVRVPVFEEVVASFPGVRIVVDLKEDAVVGPLARLVVRAGLAERLIVGSFSDARIERFRELTGGRVPTSTGALLSRRWLVSSRLRRLGGGDPSALQLPLQMRGIRVVDERLVETAHEAGLQVHVWTVNDVEAAARLFAMGVDGIVTDRPDLMLAEF